MNGNTRSMIDKSMLLKLFFLLGTLLITLVFGLHPKDFGSEHRPFVSSAGNLGFTKYSTATAHIQLPKTTNDQNHEGVLSLGVSLKIQQMPDIVNRFSVIFSVNDIEGKSQILLGQWENYLIVMSGDDYANQNNHPRITIPLASVEGYEYPQSVSVQIEATAVKTSVTINQQSIAHNSGYLAPIGHTTLSVSLGNTLNRKHGWTGELSDFELDLFSCPSEDSEKAESRCATAYSINLQNINQSSTAVSDIQPAWTLESPYNLLSTEWLSKASLEYWNTPTFYRDVVINLLGFVPVSLAIFIIAATRYQLTKVVVITITTTFMISLLIESAQVLLPSRTSSIVDLTVNSFAGMSTSLLCYVGMRTMNR